MSQFKVIDERFRTVVLPDVPLLTLDEGYAWSEGPVWFACQDCFLVSVRNAVRP